MKNLWKKLLAGVMLASMLIAPVSEAGRVVVRASMDAETRANIEMSLYNAEYYAKANEDVAVALNNDAAALYQHWLNYGKAEGRNASMVFNAKYYLEVNPDVAAVVGNDYVAAYEHFVNSGLLEGRESSPVFSVKYYLEANTDVANAFNNDYVMAARHFNESAIAEGRSGSGNFDYTVYRECNTDVAALYGDYVQGYYIHYINHGRAEGRTGGLGVGGSGSVGGDNGNDNTGGETGGAEIDVTAPSYRIFDAAYYVERYPELEQSVGIDADALYLYWLNEGIAQGQTASPVIVPEEYLELNSDVADVFGDNYAAALNHFLNNGIYEGRTGSYEFDYTIYESCNTDVGGVFADDIVGYYFHYVKYGKAENRTAAPYIPEPPKVVQANKLFTSGLAITPFDNGGKEYGDDRFWGDSEICAYVDGISQELTKGSYGITVYIPDGELEDGIYGIGISFSREKSPYAFYDYRDGQFDIKNGTLDEDSIYIPYERISTGYLVYLTSSYRMEEAVDDVILIIKLHCSAPGKNGSMYFGDFFIADEASGQKFYSLSEEGLTWSAERLSTGEEVTVQTEYLTDISLKHALKSMTVGTSFALEIAENSETITYSSSAEDVAVVSADGVITALAEGTTKIAVANAEKGTEHVWELAVTETYVAPEPEDNNGIFATGLEIYPHDNKGQAYEHWWRDSEIFISIDNAPINVSHGIFGLEFFVPQDTLGDGEYGVEVMLYQQTEDGNERLGNNQQSFYITGGKMDQSRNYLTYTEVPMGYVIRVDVNYSADNLLDTLLLEIKLHSESPTQNGAYYLGNAYLGDAVYGSQRLDWSGLEPNISAVITTEGEAAKVAVTKLFTAVESVVRELYIGESAFVKIAEDNTQELIFSTSDVTVAVVDSRGEITAIRPGTTKVTVEAEDGAAFSWILTVKEATVGLEVEKNSIRQGTTYQYVGKGLGIENPTFIWSSSDATVGTIDAASGLFTALKEGITNITLTDSNSGKSYTFAVRVYEVSNSELEEYITINTNGLISAELEQKVTKLLYDVYQNVFDYFADGEYNPISCTFQEMDGVAYTVGRDIYVNSHYINANPADVDCITHELIHCAQYYPGGDVWLIEGITDYGRSLFGLYNDEANWSLATYQKGQSYTDSYGVTGGFLKYVVEAHNENMVQILNHALKQNSYSGDTWVESTGYTIDELWQMYAGLGVTNAVEVLYVAETVSLNVVGASEGAELKFETDDEAVAVVTAKGELTAMGVGATWVTVTDTTNGNEFSWRVRVIAPYVAPVVAQSRVAMGATYQFAGLGYGIKNTEFVWSSSETSVGVIDEESGLFTALAEGSTVITLKDKNSKKEASFTVEVYDASDVNVRDYITVTTNGLISEELEQKIIDTLCEVYPEVFNYFSRGEYYPISCTFQEMDGVAYTTGDREIYVNSHYINSRPEDVDCITHELIHCAQSYAGGEVWLIEGITDYGRSLFGLYNEEAGWSLSDYQDGQSYTDSYGVTGGFLKYVVENHNSNMVLLLNEALKEGSCPDRIWTDNTGYTIDELWAQYAAQ